MQSQFSQSVIRFTVRFSTIFLHVHKAGKLRPADDYFDEDLNFEPILDEWRVGGRGKGRPLERGKNDRSAEKSSGILNRSTRWPLMRRRTRKKKGTASHSATPYKRLSTFYPLAAKLQKYSLIFNIYILLKYSIICPLDTRLFDEYRYLDCILLGRFLLDGRAMNLSRYVALFLAVINTVWRIEMYLFTDRYDFGVVELMYTDLEKIVCDQLEEELNGNGLQRNELSYREKNLNSDRFKQLVSEATKSSLARIEWETNTKSSNKQYDHDDLFKAKWCKHRRPVRTTEAWLFIAKNITRYSLMCLLAFCIAFVLMAYIHAPLYVTQLGFRLSNDHCTDWIVWSFGKSQLHGYDSLSAIQQFSLKHIFNPNSANATITKDMKAVILDYGEFPEFNLYHTARFILSFSETVTICCELVSFFFAGLVLVSINVRQVRYYIHFLRRRLEAIKLALEEVNLLKSFSSAYLTPDHANMKSKLFNNYDLKEIELYTQHLQGMMIDMFKTVKSSNVFVKDFTTRCLSIWLGYSALTLGWMFQPGPFLETSKLECYMMHAFATIYMCALVSSTSKVKKASDELYKLSASCMAISDGYLESKTRWCDVMHFYHPYPLNCFTVFERAQLSWFLAMKVVASLFSAMFVASTFYAYYQ